MLWLKFFMKSSFSVHYHLLLFIVAEIHGCRAFKSKKVVTSIGRSFSLWFVIENANLLITWLFRKWRMYDIVYDMFWDEPKERCSRHVTQIDYYNLLSFLTILHGSTNVSYHFFPGLYLRKLGVTWKNSGSYFCIYTCHMPKQCE